MITYGKVPVVATLIVTLPLPVRWSPGLAGFAARNFISNVGNRSGSFVNTSFWSGWTLIKAGVTFTLIVSGKTGGISSSLSGKVIRVENYLSKMLRQENYHRRARFPRNAVDNSFGPARPQAAITAPAPEPLESLSTW
jgi:hypothetical protein